MRYIGCKRRLLPFISEVMKLNHIEGNIFCDLFAGTATVGNYFKQQSYQVISNDLLYCSYVQQKVKIGLNKMPSFEKIAKHLNLNLHKTQCLAQAIIDYLNQLEGIESFIYQNYTAGGTQDKEIFRLYYIDENAKKIDVIRETIEEWRQLKLINDDEFFILLYALLDGASNCANTTASMESFLKTISSKALHTINLKLPAITPSRYKHRIYCQDGLTLLDELPTVDILYIDPPYTNTQYIAAYHILETIARWDYPVLRGITGRRDMLSLRSTLSNKSQAVDSFKQIVASNCYHHLLLSYSEDGLVPHETLLTLLQQFGEVTISTQSLKRYNSLPPSHPHCNPRTEVEERLYYVKPYAANLTLANPREAMVTAF